MSRQRGQAVCSRCLLRGTSQEFYHEHNARAPEAGDAAVAASSRRPRSSGAPRSLLQQTRSCAPAREQPSKAQEPPGQENYSTQRFRAASGFSSPHLYYTGSDCTERAAGPGREQGTCTSEACGTNWLQNRSK